MKLRVLNATEYGLTAGTEYQLSSAPFSIGRETDNDLVIPDASVSRKHCIFHKEADSWIVEDNHSLNGFSINDKKIDGASEIFNGDIIKVHDLILQVVDETAAEPPKPVTIPPKPQVKITTDEAFRQQAPLAAEEQSAGKGGLIFKVVLLVIILAGCVWMLVQILSRKESRPAAPEEAPAEVVEQPAAPEEAPVAGNAGSLLSEEDLKELQAAPPKPAVQRPAPVAVASAPVEAASAPRESRAAQRDDEEAQPTLVLVESTPSGADIVIDREPRGKTPAIIRDVEAGRHTLELTAPGYEKFVTQIDVPDELPEKPYKMVLKEGIVSVVTEPAGAWVMEGKIFKGVTPLMLEGLSEGKHELLIYGPACEVHKETVEVTASKGEEVNVALKSTLGGLEITTRPPECNVFLNGILVGRTKPDAEHAIISEPLVVPNIMSGNYVLKVEHATGAFINSNITIPKRSNCVQKASLWIPTHKLKLLDGTVIIGMMLEKNEHGDVVMELPSRRPERYLKPQIDNLAEMDLEEAKEAVEKYGKANRGLSGGSARGEATVLKADDLAAKAEGLSAQTFNQMYQNRQLTITGKPSMLMKEGGLYAVMFGTRLKCLFSQGTPAADYDTMSTAKAEDGVITIRGLCAGKANEMVTLKNCILEAD